MRIAMPNMPESLTYSVAAAIALIVFIALVLLAWGDLPAALLALAISIGVYWLVGRNLATLVTARDAALATAALMLLCALADLLIGFPYQAILFLLAAAALGVAFMLLQQGTVPVELRLGGVLVVAASSDLMHLHMLEELRDAGLLTAEEFAIKRDLLGV